VPLATFGGVEREQVDPQAVLRRPQRVGAGDPTAQREAVTAGLLAQEVEDARGHPPVGLLALVGVGVDHLGGGLEHVVGPRP
jgi:hypothetical protein